MTALETFKSQTDEIFSKFQEHSLLHINFANYAKRPDASETEKCVENAAETLFVALKSLPDADVEAAFADLTSRRSLSRLANTVVNMVIKAVQQNHLLSLKCICEKLLTTPALSIKNLHVWYDTFDFVLKNVSCLDYKSVRDVLKLLLDLPIPVHLASEHRKAVEISEQVTAYICSRENNLLPAYFVITEIRKTFPEPQCFSHWRLADLFNSLVESFRPLAQMNSLSGRCYLTPVLGHMGFCFNAFWRLEPQLLRFPLKGCLPYSQNLMQPQYHLVYQIFMHSTYRESMNVLLGPPKQERVHLSLVEEVMAAIILELMYEAECDHNNTNEEAWKIITAQIVCLALQQSISFTRLVKNLHNKLCTLPYRFARNQLMWCLFNFISGGIQKGGEEEFVVVLDLYRLLYSGNDTFTASGSDPACAMIMSATCVWIHILAKLPHTDVDIPPTISTQIMFFQDALKNKSQFNMDNFMLAVLCNAYSSTTEIFKQELYPILMDSLDSVKVPGATCSGVTVVPSTVFLPGGASCDNHVRPLKSEFIDCLSVHVRVNVAHGACSALLRFMQNKSHVCPSPGLMETYCRLLSRNDTEMMCLKNFISDVVVMANKQHNLEMMFTICEIISCRLTTVPGPYRVHLLCSMQVALNAAPFQQNAGIYWMLENTLLRSIQWFPYWDTFQSAFSRLLTLLCGSVGDSLRGQEEDELLKAVILALARATTIAHSDCSVNEGVYRDLLGKVPAYAWPQTTLQFFPPPLCTFYAHHQTVGPSPRNYTLLRQQVDEEYMKHLTFGAELSLIDYFANTSTTTTYLCVVWRLLQETGELPAVALKILESLGPKKVILHMHTLADFVVHETINGDVNRCVDILNQMIFQYNVMPLERFVLTMIFRPYEGNEAFYSMVVVVLLFQQSQEFRQAVSDCVHLLPVDVNGCQDWYDKHCAYHKKNEEKSWAQMCAELNRKGRGGADTPSPIEGVQLPVYYTNRCFRLLPILDLLFQRLIEMPAVCSKFFEPLVDAVSALYRFHPLPVSFLYVTFRFYEKRLIDSPRIKQRLLCMVNGATHSLRGDHWLLSSEYLEYCALAETSDASGDPSLGWRPSADYYAKLIGKFVHTFSQPRVAGQRKGDEGGPCEFNNAQTHVLHTTCVELMALPLAAAQVGQTLIDLVLNWHRLVDKYVAHYWFNAIGLVITALPISYVEPLYQSIVALLASPELPGARPDLFGHLEIEQECLLMCDEYPGRLLALAHAIWAHSTTGCLQLLVQAVRVSWKPIVTTESQLLYVCHLVAPLLLRFTQERQKSGMEITVDLYEMLYNVDKNTSELRHENLMCDFFYHIKYMYLGDVLRPETDRIIPQLRASLQQKLRYINFTQADQSCSTAPGSMGSA